MGGFKSQTFKLCHGAKSNLLGAQMPQAKGNSSNASESESSSLKNLMRDSISEPCRTDHNQLF